MDGHKEPNTTIYFRYEAGQGWYWCGRFIRSSTYATYDKCLRDYSEFESKTAEDFIPSAATHGGV